MEFLIGAIVLYIGFKVWQGYNEQEQKEKEEIEYTKLLKSYIEQINPHLAVLARKEKQLTVQDDYGNYNFDKYFNEVDYFIDSTLNIDKNSKIFIDLRVHIIDMVNEYKIKKIENLIDDLYFYEDMTPMEYEHFCSDLLLKNGWISNVTKQSGDQGVDVIAEYDNTRVAIQCKLYSSPVGNKAVQEVYSAQKHFDTNYAIVVTNNTYTKSAKELANTTNVLLLHHDDLNDLHTIIFN